MTADLSEHQTEVARVTDCNEKVELQQRDEDRFLVRRAKGKRRQVGCEERRSSARDSKDIEQDQIGDFWGGA